MHRRDRLLVHGTTTAWLTFTGIALLVPRSPDLGDHFEWLPVPVDKAGHFVLFFICALVLHRSLRLELEARSLFLAAMATVGYGMLTELLQALVPARTSDPADALADGLGVLAYVAVAMLGAWRRGRGGVPTGHRVIRR